MNNKNSLSSSLPSFRHIDDGGAGGRGLRPLDFDRVNDDGGAGGRG